MKSKKVACSFLWLACCAMVASAADMPAGPAVLPATQPASDPAKTAASAPSPATAVPPGIKQPLHDPTQIDAALARALAMGQGGTRLAQDLTVQVTSRGLIAIAGKPTVALIELQGSGIFYVQEGSVLNVSVKGVRTTLKVESLSRDGVVITADSKNVTVVIR